MNNKNNQENRNALQLFAINLNERAKAGKLDPVIGRDDEIRRVLQILSRRTKNNPILIGEPGTGKTAIAEGLAHRIVRGDVPENLKTKQLYSLDMGALVAGAMDAANILKPALARGELRSIGATTLNEYQKYFEKDKALERRFQIVMVDEPDVASTISILRGLKERYENHHKVRIKDDAIIAAVELSNRYITERFLPDKAIDLMDEAAAKLRLEVDSVPEELDVIERNIKQLEIEKLKFEADKAEREGDYGKVAEIRYGKVRNLEGHLASYQSELAVIQGGNALIKEEVDSEDIADAVRRSRAGLQDPKRPIGSFIFLGTTGVG
jgi:ATP-dependent Clp protease ATP-binding subunit ClpB